MKYQEKLRFLNKSYLNKIYIVLVLSFTYMAFDIFIQYLPRHVAVYYTKLKSLTRKVQRTAGSIGFVQKSLHHKVVRTFARLKGEFINRNDKLRAEQAILKSHLLEHKSICELYV